MWIWFVMPGCAIVLIIMWYIFGRDKKTISTITTSPPEGLDPLEMDYAQIATISDRGIYAQLLFWVSKGILSVKDDDGRISMFRTGRLPDDAPAHQTLLFEDLFASSDIVWLDQLPSNVSDHKRELCDKVSERFTGKNAVVQDDTMSVTMTAMAILIISAFVVEVTAGAGVLISFLLGAILFTGLVFLQNGALGFRSKHDRFELICGTVFVALSLAVDLVLLEVHTSRMFTALFAICFIICIPCILFMERRVNQHLYGQILGFREFIETAEWDQLKRLSEEDPGYGMDILPYALLFNMGTRWTAAFENKTIYACVEEIEKIEEQNEG
ncbi:MAG: DUF2207 domain-containing protein [Lachnospiraceae bacterium]|nr:DUF2207 domain-containing protein [Lachnospiraceae bacterium]